VGIIAPRDASYRTLSIERLQRIAEGKAKGSGPKRRSAQQLTEGSWRRAEAPNQDELHREETPRTTRGERRAATNGTSPRDDTRGLSRNSMRVRRNPKDLKKKQKGIE